MAFYACLEIEGIEGESAVKGHENQIDVFAWTFGAQQQGTSHIGGGSSAGKVNVDDLVIEKAVDKATPNLFMACAKGRHIPKAKLTIRKAGGDDPLDYYVIEMEDCMITSISNSVSSPDDAVIREVCTLNFAKIKESYQPQKNDGSADGGTIDAEYDIRADA